MKLVATLGMRSLWPAVVSGLIAGFCTRLRLLRVDYRQYPTYPAGAVSHLTLGFIAALLAALPVPALDQREFTAVTFLALAAQQFREIRGMERQSLEELEKLQLVPRGGDYVEGIAKVFESRNYLVMIASLTTSAVTYFLGWLPGLVVALTAVFLSTHFGEGHTVGDIAEVRPAKLAFEGTLMKIDDIIVMEVGLPEARRIILEQGLAVMLEPKNDNGRDTLASPGQRQAILHNASTILGVYRDVDTPEFTPLARRDLNSGAVGVFLVPMVRDQDVFLDIVRRSPVLESSRRCPLTAALGRRAKREVG
ncbi:MAG: YIEGIA family protein [Chloroflexota bacterium]